ncbi:MAG TPA: hypothetical protein VMH81_22045 [Bryobacteraceae bacterium]|nr:hypothetical protein [Bryobacteraceae bacterium]
MRVCCCLTALFLCVPLAAKVPLEPVQIVSTSKAELSSGGTVRIIGSTGQLDVEGWDQPEVEVTVIKSTYRGTSSKEKQDGTRDLNRLNVSTDRKSPTEVLIRTSLPGRSITRPLRGMTSIDLEYHIKVPRDAHLVIRHGSGDVRLENLTAGIDADSHMGDMVVLLPESGHYAIDAKCRVCGVYSDFAGRHHTEDLVGEKFTEQASDSGTRVRLRVGMGGIQILKLPNIATAPRP